MTRNVIAVCDDLFFASKIRGTAEQVGTTVQFVKTIADLMAKTAADLPALVIVDLHSQRCDPIQLARQLKSAPQTSGVPLLGFFSHVQTELQRNAEAAGFDRVMPRSAFSQKLVDILRGD